MSIFLQTVISSSIFRGFDNSIKIVIIYKNTKLDKHNITSAIMQIQTLILKPSIIYRQFIEINAAGVTLEAIQ